MVRPTSFRLAEELLARLEEESRTTGTSVTALVSSLLDEGLTTRRFPGVVYRDGPAGRRAGLVGGPDVWEVVRDLRHAPGQGMERLEHVAAEAALPAGQVRLALDFYAAHPEAIDRRIAADDDAATRARALIDRRERLLSQ